MNSGDTKTLQQGAAELVADVPPETPIRLTRARPCVGRLPAGWSYYHYANVCFAAGKTFVSYLRSSPPVGVAEQNLPRQQRILRIYPLAWFYEVSVSEKST